jgi:prophage regulatory protein
MTEPGVTGRKPRLSVSRIAKVSIRVGFSISSIYRKVADGTFPRPIRTGPGAIAWLDSDIDAWLWERISERDRETQALLTQNKIVWTPPEPEKTPVEKEEIQEARPPNPLLTHKPSQNV